MTTAAQISGAVFTPTNARLAGIGLGMASLGVVMSSPDSMDSLVKYAWAQQAMEDLNALERKADSYFQTNRVQRKANALGDKILQLMKPLFEFSEWIEKTHGSKWYTQVASALAKLPLKVAKLVVRTLYFILKEAVIAPFHPISSSIRLAKLLLILTEACVRPETYSLIGAGILGNVATQACFGSPTSIPCLALGAALLISGLAVGAIIAAIRAEKDQKTAAAATYLKQQITPLVVTFLSSFLLGASTATISHLLASTPLQSPLDIPSALANNANIYPNTASD